jgi:hypothetical protein
MSSLRTVSQVRIAGAMPFNSGLINGAKTTLAREILTRAGIPSRGSRPPIMARIVATRWPPS